MDYGSVTWDSSVNSLTFEYTIQASDPASLASGDIQVTDTAIQVGGAISITDNAGNALDTAISSSVSSTLTLDTVAPDVSDETVIVSASGSMKYGDTVLVGFDATAAGNTDVSAVTFDMTEFGGPSDLSSTLNGNIYEASYTLDDPTIDVTSAQVSVTVTDASGNQTTMEDGATFYVDTVKPDADIVRVDGSGNAITNEFTQYANGDQLIFEVNLPKRLPT